MKIDIDANFRTGDSVLHQAMSEKGEKEVEKENVGMSENTPLRTLLLILWPWRFFHTCLEVSSQTFASVTCTLQAGLNLHVFKIEMYFSRLPIDDNQNKN